MPGMPVMRKMQLEKSTARLAVADLSGAEIDLNVFDTGGTEAGAVAAANAALSGAELRNVQKEIAALDRALGKLAGRVDAKHVQLAEHDQSDHVGIGHLTAELRVLEAELAEKEGRWLELSELAESVE